MKLERERAQYGEGKVTPMIATLLIFFASAIAAALTLETSIVTGGPLPVGLYSAFELRSGSGGERGVDLDATVSPGQSKWAVAKVCVGWPSRDI